MVTSETPLIHWLAHLYCNTFFGGGGLSMFWSWQQIMREGFEGLFIGLWLDTHHTVVVGYTAVLCHSVKYILCYLEHSGTISWTGDQVLCHSSPSLAMRRILSCIYCAQFSVWFGIWCQNYLKLFKWMCLVWPSWWSMTLGWQKRGLHTWAQFFVLACKGFILYFWIFI